VLLGTPAADAAGSFRTTVHIPFDTAPGQHRIVVVTVRGPAVSGETILTVIAPTAFRAVAAPAVGGDRGQLTRTGSDSAAQAAAAAAMVVIGLILVGGSGIRTARISNRYEPLSEDLQRDEYDG
jgi:hypothetical protein